MTGPAPQLDPVRHGGARLRTFLNIAELWKLSRDEQMRMLDVQDPAEFEDWSANVRAHEPIEIPMEVIVRIGCVLSIYDHSKRSFRGSELQNGCGRPTQRRCLAGEGRWT